MEAAVSPSVEHQCALPEEVSELLALWGCHECPNIYVRVFKKFLIYYQPVLFGKPVDPSGDGWINLDHVNPTTEFVTLQAL